MLAGEAKVGREIHLLFVAVELEAAGVALTDGEVDAAQSIEDLVQVVGSRLIPSPDRDARAANLVAEAAQRVARLVGKAD